MQIRSVTAFVDAQHPASASDFESVAVAIQKVRSALESAGYVVQTTRLATQPFPAILPEETNIEQIVDLAKNLEAIAFLHQIDYVSLGTVRLVDQPAYLEGLIEVFKATDNVFGSIEIANREIGFSLPRIRQTAEVIQEVANIKEDGFKNLYLTAAANVAPWSPFFPAAYHGSGTPSIGIATESADIAVNITEDASTLSDVRKGLVKAVEQEAAKIEEAATKALRGQDPISFQGIDFSLAPFPDATRSIGRALENLGIAAFGRNGTLMATAFLTDTLDRARFTRTGFCGLMLPLLEDEVLAQRATTGNLHVTDLLAYSAVCGTGLDLLALPGEISSDTMAGILLDVAALSLRLNKPLTARLMPLPGKNAGDPVIFDFEYFANSRVLDVHDEPLNGMLTGEDSIALQPRRVM